MRDARYDILFEPVAIGPVTARNRFYQVPHCNGMGNRYPNAVAAMRGVKAEGGWAVVSTEEVEIHPTSDLSPYVEGRIWDNEDLPGFRVLTDAVHAHGSLAAIELVHNGHHAENRYSRAVPIAPTARILDATTPVHARAMDKEDIRALRRWYRNAALRSRDAGFDIVYVYAAHDMTILQHFLCRRSNQRTDEYGGSLENRVRLFREVIEETKEAVGDRCAVAVRLAVDELLGDDGISSTGEGHDTVAMLAELPDLWDVNISGWENDSQTSRFSEEGFQEPYISFVKSLTSKPVVGVGRYTSPDAMVRVIKSGIMDMIGAARPSIADPFLPKKIEDGRPEDIRECIGCNICVSGDMTIAPMRCTQNPTMSEEWRSGWHPETIAPARSDERVLIVGGGAAGLEAARALGQRGVPVAIAEQGEAWGGRVRHEARLPGLSAWMRVIDWRLGQLHKMPNVEMYLASEMSAKDVLAFGAEHIVLATGSAWRRDAVGRSLHHPLPGADEGAVLLPDDVFAGQGVSADGPVVIFDDEHYYMGGVLAEVFRAAGHQVVLMTSAADVSTWTHNTLEQDRIQRRLLELGVAIRSHRIPVSRDVTGLEIACTYTGVTERIACGTLVPVTSRQPELALRDALVETLGEDARRRVTRIGDCEAPTTIAAVVHSGHAFAQNFGRTIDPDGVPFRREPVMIFDAGG